MNEILLASPLIFISIIGIIFSKYCIKDYRKKYSEVKILDTITYGQFLHHIMKRIYLLSIIILIATIVRIVYSLFYE
jgi:hypothetical protein